METHDPEADDGAPRGVDLRGTWRLVRGVPGLVPLILFSCFNNVIGGAFMALMDAYACHWCRCRCGGCCSGAPVGADDRRWPGGREGGAGECSGAPPPARQRRSWAATMLFPLSASVVSSWRHGGVHAAHALRRGRRADGPAARRPLRRQGRVFGFAQSVEQAASPFTAFLIGPVTQFAVVPFMSGDGAGAAAVGSWFGTGRPGDRAGVRRPRFLGLLVTLLALASPSTARCATPSRAPARRRSRTGPRAGRSRRQRRPAQRTVSS